MMKWLTHIGHTFLKGAGQSFSCRDICPAGLPLDDIQARANAYAVWKK